MSVIKKAFEMQYLYREQKIRERTTTLIIDRNKALCLLFICQLCYIILLKKNKRYL